MPVYEYDCPECRNRFQLRMAIIARDRGKCPECGSPGERRMSLTNHTFGWRLTDQSHVRFSTDEYVRDV